MGVRTKAVKSSNMMMPNHKVGTQIAVLVHKLSSWYQGTRLTVHTTDLRVYHAHHHPDWKQLQSELMVLEMTDTPCECYIHDAGHRLWKIVEEQEHGL